MMKNMQRNMFREDLCRLLDSEGFAGLYDFVYVPCDLKNGHNLGYGFVNLTSHHTALESLNHFDGFCGDAWGAEACAVAWSSAQQGRHEHEERYRNSPLMHASVSDCF